MNCSDFQANVNEIVSFSNQETNARRKALMHAHDCLSCSNLLAQQRSLNNGLQNLALATEEIPDAARLKNSVLAAFQEQQAASFPAAPTTFRWNWQWGFTGAAFAAMACLALGIYFIYVPATTKPTEQAKLVMPADRQTLQVLESQDTNAVTESSSNKITKNNVSKAAMIRNTAKKTAQNSVTRASAKQNSKTADTANNIAQKIETTTDYIPLTYAADERALQNGVVVRLEVPRSTLIAMGAPLNVETKDVTITADVLMGDNGVAYAYRLVK